MGNFTSCCFSTSFTKVFDVHGGVKMVSKPITAAELMLEAPGHVVCNIETLVKSRRIVPLKADDELEVNGGVYMLVQVNRIGCIVSELEIAIIQSACDCSYKKSRQCSAKVIPEQKMEPMSTSGNRVRQYWIPVLEPIAEVI